jgi:hypothetical protein
MKAPDLASYRVRVPACQLFQYKPHDFVVVSSSSSNYSMFSLALRPARNAAWTMDPPDC